MKNIFKKTMTVLGSVALVGATAGFASAAAYPSPFDEGAVIVTGSNAAASDGIAAAKVDTGLKAHAASMSSGGSLTPSGNGDVHKFEKSSTKFNLGDTITGVYGTAPLDEGELEELLAEGTYEDSQNEEFDYKQEIQMNALQLTMFSDSDYDDEYPTIGFNIPSGTNILNYTLDFTDQPTMSDMADSDLMLMGKEYYVLSVASSNDVITLLDSASELAIAEGDTKTVSSGGQTYEISIDYIGSTEVSLNINGEITNTLAEGQTQKLDDGSYVGVKELRYVSKDTGISSTVISIGKGKIILTDGQDIEINDNAVNDLAVTITNSSGELDQLTIQWDADDDYFVTEESEIVMPAFEAVKLSFGGLDMPAEEMIRVDAGADDYMSIDLPIQDGDVSIDFLYSNGTDFIGIGKDATNLLATSATGSFTFDGDTYDYFVASYDDGNDAESYLMRATNFKVEDSINKTTFQYNNDGTWTDAESEAEAGDEFTIGSVELTVGAINKDAKTVVVSNGSANTNFYTLFSEEGAKMYLPHTDPGYLGYINFTGGSGADASWTLQFQEEDEDGDIGQGDKFNVTLGHNSQTPGEVTVSDVVGEDVSFVEIEDSDEYRSFMYSALATELLWDQSGDQESLKIMYHGGEVTADVYITAAEVGLSSGGETGIKTAKDTETSMYAGQNIVVIGGSAINTVAAELLGDAYRGEAFTQATGVAAGGFLIQSFDRGGKTALLVAGYNAADTSKAVDYLVNNEEDVDTAAGTKYTGTSATEASLVVA